MTIIFQSLWGSLYRNTAPLLSVLPLVLVGVLCLALVFRLGSDIFGRAAGGLAAWLLATLALPGGAALGLPYLTLIAITLALHITFFRGYYCHHRLRSVYFLLVIVAVYSYTPLVYIVILHLVWVWLSPNRERKTLYFYGIIGLAVLPRLLFLPAELLFWQGVETAQTFLPVSPAPLQVAPYAVLLGLAGVNLLTDDDRWVRNLLLVFGMVFAIQLVLPASLILNLLTAIPILVLLAARGLTFLAWPIRVSAALLLALPLLLPGTISLWSSNREPAAAVVMPPDSRVIFSAPAGWQHILMGDQLRSTAALIAPANQFHLMDANERRESVSGQAASVADSAAVHNLTEFMGASPDIWWMEMDSLPAAADFRAQLETLYAPFAAWQWFDTNTPSDSSLALTHYRRMPDNLSSIYIYGEQVTLLNWQLPTEVVVHPCQSVPFQSWWQVTETAAETVSMTLVLVGADGQGIARADGMPGYIETPLWQVERPYPDERVLTIPCDILPGEYPLLLGLYRFAGSSPQNLPVTLPDETPLGELAYLTTLIVP